MILTVRDSDDTYVASFYNFLKLRFSRLSDLGFFLQTKFFRNMMSPEMIIMQNIETRMFKEHFFPGADNMNGLD